MIHIVLFIWYVTQYRLLYRVWRVKYFSKRKQIKMSKRMSPVDNLKAMKKQYFFPFSTSNSLKKKTPKSNFMSTVAVVFALFCLF